MRRKWKKLAAIMTAAALAVTMAGCGGQNDGNSGSSSSEGAEVQGEVAAGESAQGSSTIYVEAASDPGNYQPSTRNAGATQVFLLNVYEGLFERAYSGEYEPLLAESYEWTDDTHMTIKLHDNIVTHAGDPVKAEDVLWSIQWAAESAEYSRHTTNIDFDNTKVVDDLTLELAIFEPNVFFLNDLSRIQITAKKTFEESEDNLINIANGTGPYKMTGHTEGVEVVLEKFEDYWDKDNTARDRQLQNFDKIVFKFISEAAQQTIELESGGVDILYDTPTNDLDSLRNNDEFEVFEYVTGQTVTMYFNSSENSVCNNQTLRQAIRTAIDNQAIVAAVYGGNARAATTIISPDNKEWSDDLAVQYPFDQDKAKQLLKDAGYAEGELTLKLATDDSNERKAIAEIIQAQLGQIGITVEINTYDAGSFNSLWGDNESWDMQINQFSALGSVLFYFNNQVNREKNVRGFWEDDAFQELLAPTIRDGNAENIMKLVDMFEEASPVCPLVNKTVYFTFRKGLTDYKIKNDANLIVNDVAVTDEASSWLYD
ncbi:MAG: ABC transporter substrate-binding protein [Lachnospiraceae bacterium]|nr:ABC transporter substrate-binding protein [Lachnospiraceae bacterium]